jgi:hypothetical protein
MAKKKTRKKGLPPQLKKWNGHLKKVRDSNPGKSLKQCMKIAKSTYKK